MTEPAAPPPLYVDTFRIDVGVNGVAILTFGSPLASFADRRPVIQPTVSVAMTENKLAELAEILAQRGRKDPVLKFKSAPSELRSQG